MVAFPSWITDRLRKTRWDPVRGTGNYGPAFLNRYYTDDPSGPPSQDPRRRARTPSDDDPKPTRDLDRRAPSADSMRVFGELLYTQAGMASGFAMQLEGNGYRLAATHAILAADQFRAAGMVLAHQTGGEPTSSEVAQTMVGQVTNLMLMLSGTYQACCETGDKELAHALADASHVLRRALEPRGVIGL